MIIDIHVHKSRFDDNVILDLIHYNEKMQFPVTWTESRELTEKQYKRFVSLVESI